MHHATARFGTVSGTGESPVRCMATRNGCLPTPATRGRPMSVITRSALEASPLADLHLIASELGIDGYRRLRKADLVDKIIAQQGGEEAVAAAAEETPEADAEPKRRTRSGRGGRAR